MLTSGELQASANLIDLLHDWSAVHEDLLQVEVSIIDACGKRVGKVKYDEKLTGYVLKVK